MILLLLASVLQTALTWPDGSPCLMTAYESMNPLEAVEHQGGLQLTPPPYEIKVDQKCYWRNQPLTLHLQGVNESVWYKGFALQPFEWRGDQHGERMGQFMRLDDNGSWQQQCFRFKNAATHSHDEKKKHLRLWWKVDEDSRTVQFIATVVKHQTMFWVKSVLSNPIPPCRVSKTGYDNYKAPLPTPPPPVKQFKMDTNRLFGSDHALPLPPPDNGPEPQPVFRPTAPVRPRPQSVLRPAPQQRIQTQPETTTTTPLTTRPTTQAIATSAARMRQIIPVQDGFQSRQPATMVFQTRTTEEPVVFQTRPTTIESQSLPVTQTPFSSPRISQQQQFAQQHAQQFTFFRPQQAQTSFRQPFISSIQTRPITTQFQFPATPDVRRPTAMVRFCFDRDGAERCVDWLPYCRSERFYTYMRSYCARSCGFC